MTRPGDRLRSLALRLFSTSVMERLIDPAIADLQCEYAEAMRRGRIWRSRWIRFAGYLAFWKVAAVEMASIAATQPAWALADGGAVGRTIRFSGIATTVTVALLVWMPLRNLSRQVIFGDPSLLRLSLLPLYLIPQALAVALPMGLVFGVLYGLRGRAVTVRSRTTIIALAVGVSLATLAVTGGLLPEANQAFRETVAGRPVARGLNELSLRELASGNPYQFHMRLALAVAPLTLGLFSLGLAAAIRASRRTWIATLISVAICFVYYVILYHGGRLAFDNRVPGFAGAWAANLVFAASALLLHLRTRGRSAARPSHPGDGPRSEGRPVIPPA